MILQNLRRLSRKKKWKLIAQKGLLFREQKQKVALKVNSQVGIVREFKRSKVYQAEESKVRGQYHIENIDKFKGNHRLNQNRRLEIGVKSKN